MKLYVCGLFLFVEKHWAWGSWVNLLRENTERQTSMLLDLICFFFIVRKVYNNPKLIL